MNDLYDSLVHDEGYLKVFRDMLILGVAGTNGAGKDSLMDLLRDVGFLVYNTSDHLREVARASLGSTDRGGNDSPMGRVGNAERTRYPGGMVELGLIDWWARASHLPDDLRPRGLVIGSIRGTGEVERLHLVGGRLILIDADPRVRYERITGRSRTDELGQSFADFMSKETAEMAVGQTDPTKFGMDAVIKAADIVVQNNGTLAEFPEKVKQTLHQHGIDLSL